MGVKKNILYSSALTVSNYIFPLIVFPYVSRTLGVEKIGLCNWVDSIIQYFVLFSMLGISIMGIREIAANKNNKVQLGRTFSGLLLLNGITTILAIVILSLLILFIPTFNEHKELFYIGASKLLFNLFLIEWFYKGIEDFKYITIRSVAVKLLYIIALFLLVRNSSDYVIYYTLTISTVMISAIWNFAYSRKFVSLVFKNLKISLLIKPFIVLGTYMLLSSMYSTFNVAYLGFEAGKTEVGYYTTATKLFGIILGIYTAFTGVIMPRISSLISENSLEEVKRIIGKTFVVLYSICFPIIIYGIVFAPEIIDLIGGEEFNGAIFPMQLIMPLILIIGIEQILVIQLLIPFKSDKAILINSLASAIIGVSLSFLLIPIMGSVGSAIAWICSEISVLCLAKYFVTKRIKIKIFNEHFFKNLVLSVPYLFIYILIESLMNNRWMVIGATVMVACVYFGITQIYILKNELIRGFAHKMLHRS